MLTHKSKTRNGVLLLLFYYSFRWCWYKYIFLRECKEGLAWSTRKSQVYGAVIQKFFRKSCYVYDIWQQPRTHTNWSTIMHLQKWKGITLHALRWFPRRSWCLEFVLNHNVHSIWKNSGIYLVLMPRETFDRKKTYTNEREDEGRVTQKNGMKLLSAKFWKHFRMMKISYFI